MRAFYRGYSARTGRRAAQVRRLHIMREDGPMPGRQGECGTTGWDVTHSPAIVLDPAPQTPPAGLAWCPRCVGLAAARTGLLDQWAAQLAAEVGR
ncbi:hypothetical protein SEA_PICARD_40 [Streptomyces phage Picard]|uniref:Uncharacterized protein n=1 Tax=Streptomyces phage Picard TaxID=1920311 RepID=A0A1J0MCC8_9CAUD|nr:hypothetical protein HOR45_gp40 [Streptomyces phage Picard]APD18570.1 hypothetical protein SEA_PICARD_40 [Streptomyces phage Picard]